MVLNKLKSVFQFPSKPCKYCGQDVRLPFQYHKVCKQKYKAGETEILSTTIDCVVKQDDTDELSKRVDKIAFESFIPEGEKLSLLANGLDSGVELILKAKDITPSEEQYIRHFIFHFSGIDVYVKHNNTLIKIDNVKFLSRVRSGDIPEIELSPDAPVVVKLLKSEKLIYVFQQEVQYYRVMQSGLKYESRGQLAITNKHIYYTSNVDSFRIKFESISNIFPNHGGVEIHKFSANEKPKVFQSIDGEFATELINLLAKPDK